MKTKYINPFTDYGFKKLFGEEVSKKLLISFLNDLLPIRDQAQKGDWDFKLEAVYCVGLLGFEFEKEKVGKEYINNMQLKNQNNKIFYD